MSVLDKTKQKRGTIVVNGKHMDVLVTESYDVIAYDAAYAGYGDNRSRAFDNEEDAIAYAKGLEDNYAPSVHYRLSIDISTISSCVWDWRTRNDM